MLKNNNSTTQKGNLFQKQTAEILSTYLDINFFENCPIIIGNPPKKHRFDLVSNNSKVVIECKAYSWTETGHVPSSKLSMVNEAAFYLSFLPYEIERFIAMRKATHIKRNETLADYYYRTNKNLLNRISVLEIDIDNQTYREIRNDLS